MVCGRAEGGSRQLEPRRPCRPPLRLEPHRRLGVACCRRRSDPGAADLRRPFLGQALHREGKPAKPSAIPIPPTSLPSPRRPYATSAAARGFLACITGRRSTSRTSASTSSPSSMARSLSRRICAGPPEHLLRSRQDGRSDGDRPSCGLGPLEVPKYAIGPMRFARLLLCMTGGRSRARRRATAKAASTSTSSTSTPTPPGVRPTREDQTTSRWATWRRSSG